MNYKDRKKVIQTLLYLESKYPVNSWMVEGLSVWPLLKLELWHAIKTGNYKVPVKKGRLFSLIKTYLKKVIFLPDYFRFLFLNEKADVLLLGAQSHNIKLDGVWLNRYFLMIKKLLNRHNLSFQECQYYSKTKISNVWNLDNLVVYFQPISVNVQSWPGFTEFRHEFAQEYRIEEFFVDSLINHSLNSLTSWSNLFDKFLGKISPKYCIGLCYYSPPMAGLILTGKKSNVKVIDLQHGSHGPLHLGYTFEDSFDAFNSILPSEFWSWDVFSANHIKTWIGVNKSVYVTGNPWIAESQELRLKNDFNDDKPTILYTAQKNLEPIIDDYLVETIDRTKEKYNWWIRLHPRSSKNQLHKFEEILRKADLIDVVEYKLATSLSLPVILKFAFVHISKYSGSVLEAAQVGVPSIVLEGMGIDTFSDIIEGKLAKGIFSPSSEKIIETINAIDSWFDLTKISMNKEFQLPEYF